MAPGLERLSSMIDRIYETVTYLDRWPAALEAIREHTGCAAAVVQVRLPARGAGKSPALLRYRSAGLDPAIEARYVESLHAADAGWRGVLAATVPGIVDEAGEAGSFEREFLSPQRLRRVVALAVSPPARGVIAGLLLYARGPAPDRASLDRLAAPLLSHVGRALSLAFARRQEQDDWLTLLDALDRVPSGLLFVDAEGRITWRNRVAGAILARGAGLLEGAGGKLTAADEAAAMELRSLLSHALSQGDGGALAVSQGHTGPPVLVTVPARAPGRAAFTEPTLAVIAADPSRPRGVAARLTDFGLTPAEARVAEALSSGLSPKEVATRLGVRVGTVRTHLRSIFSRLRVTRQADLVRVVAELSTLGA